MEVKVGIVSKSSDPCYVPLDNAYNGFFLGYILIQLDEMKKKDNFLTGLEKAKQYVSEFGSLNPDSELEYKGYRLDEWINTYRESIIIGTLSDERIDMLNQAGLDLGPIPKKYAEWFEIAKKWLEDNGADSWTADIEYNGYSLGRCMRRNIKLFPILLEIEKKEKKYQKELLQRKKEEEEKQKNFGILQTIINTPDVEICLTDIKNAFKWVKRMINTRDEEALSEIVGLLDRQMAGTFKSRLLSIDGKYTECACEIFLERYQKIFDKPLQYGENRELARKRFNNDKSAVISIKVSGRSIDYYRVDVKEARKDCEYYEVEMLLTTLFSEEQFIGYVKKNAQLLINQAREAVIDYIYKKEKVVVEHSKIIKNKATYGTATHSVFVMFMRLP